MKLKFFTPVLALIVLLASPMLFAENATRTGGYVIHHNALTTDNLSPQIASAYKIKRSKNRGLINISVQRREHRAPDVPVRAEVRVVSRSLFGQVTPIEVREIQEGQAIYYIGDFAVSNRQVMHFEIEAVPEGSLYPLRAHLRQEFFTD